MARTKRGRGRGARVGTNNPQNTGNKTNGEWSEPEMHNERMEGYYRAQNILPDEEYQLHWEAFRKPLPTTFRITGSKEDAILMRTYMTKTFFPDLEGKTFEGKILKAPEVIEWYPDQLAYKLDIPKQAIRKNADFKAFQKFLVMESESGNLVRQEVVSMIPPLLMDIKQDSSCLDMCAAPGSKTSQMVEYLHASATDSSGLILANDSDFKRAYMLVHQVKRLNSPNFVVTNHDATFISNFHCDANKSVLRFDRVLADVPCSGDGTMRKNFDVWKKWDVRSGLSLHPTQVNCLRRGLQMLKVGGRLVYSTCSLNPIENEAVLCAVLSAVQGAAHLVDVTAELPGLDRRPGLSTWKPTDTDGNYIEKITDVKKDRHRFPISVFPPEAELAASLHLERALRIYPHLGDTGGFFVAVIDKTAEISADFESVRQKTGKRKFEADETDETSKKVLADRTETIDSNVSLQDEDILKEIVVDQHDSLIAQASETVEQVIPKPKFMKSLNDEYFKFLSPDHPDLANIFDFYGISGKLARDCFLSRNITGEPVRSLYITSPLVKKILEHNEGRIKFVHAGVKVFHKQNTDNLQDGSLEAQGMCKWRIAQDGIDVVKDYIDKDKFVQCNLDELIIFMKHEYPRASLFDLGDKSVMRQLEGKRYGCYILRCDLRHEARSRLPEVVEVPLWKSKVTIQMMIARKDKEAIYTRITGQELPPAIRIDNKTIENLEKSDQPKLTTTEIGQNNGAGILEDQNTAVDISIQDSIAHEEEGTASNVL